MAISRQALAYCKRGIIQYLAGNTKEFKRLVNKAMEYNEQNNLIRCRYKVDGKFINAKIDMSKGIIYSLDGKVLRKCLR